MENIRLQELERDVRALEFCVLWLYEQLRTGKQSKIPLQVKSVIDRARQESLTELEEPCL